MSSTLSVAASEMAEAVPCADESAAAGPVDPARAATKRKVARYHFMANMHVIGAYSRVIDSLLDKKV